MGFGFECFIEYFQVLYAAYPEITVAVTQFAPADQVPGLAVMTKSDGLYDAFRHCILARLIADPNFFFIA